MPPPPQPPVLRRCASAMAPRLSNSKSGRTSASAAPDAVAPDDATQSLAEDVAALRVLDAAANRGVEGLRVVEDYVRSYVQ